MTQLTPEQDVFLDQTADFVRRSGLRVPTLMALDAGRPLTFLAGQMLWLAQPVLALLLPGKKVAKLARVLEKPEAISALISRLEAGDA
jgi:hypothetical protein